METKKEGQGMGIEEDREGETEREGERMLKQMQ